MRYKLMGMLFAVLASTIGGTTPILAQSAAFEGTFLYAEEQSDNVEEAINEAVRGMNFITRPVARGRLKKTNNPYSWINIMHTPEQVKIVMDGRDPITTPANGTPTKWTREDGEVFDVSTEWENGKLEQTFKAEDGQRVNVYSLSGDGNTLTMQVTVTSPRLPEPVEYKLVYRRQT